LKVFYYNFNKLKIGLKRGLVEEGLLELRKVDAVHGPVQVLRNILLRVEAGQIVSLIGARGAGKSTLLKVISGIRRSYGGVIRFQNRDITHSSPREIVPLGISLVPEGGQLFTRLSVRENLRLGAYFYHNRKFKPDIEERLAWVYAVLPPLRRLSNRMAGAIGREEQQMTAIGRSLMARPKLLLLDEPSRGLHPRAAREIFRTARYLKEQGTTILLAERNFREALQIADYSYILEAGAVVREGPAPEMLAGNNSGCAWSVLPGRPGLDSNEANAFHEP
jgi:branched-chain amino acid transport system ATP-binding protein